MSSVYARPETWKGGDNNTQHFCLFKPEKILHLKKGIPGAGTAQKLREFYFTRLPVPASKTDSSYRYGYEKTFLENHNIFENVF